MVEKDITASVIFVHFASFAKIWLIPGGSVQKNMVVYYFRQVFPQTYRYEEQASDEEIEKCLEEWNKMTVKAEVNEMGMYIGFQINFALEKEIKEKEERRVKRNKVKEILKECRRTGKKPSDKVLRLALEFELIKIPKEVTQKNGAEPAAEAAAEAEPEADTAATKKKVKKKVAGDGTVTKKKKKGKDKSLAKSLAGEEVAAEPVVVFKRGKADENDPEKKVVKKKVAKKKKAADSAPKTMMAPSAKSPVGKKKKAVGK